MKTITISDSVYVDVDIQIEFEKLLEIISESLLTQNQIKSIIETIASQHPCNFIPYESVSDVMKLYIIKDRLSLYSVEELEKRLNPLNTIF